MDGGAEFPAFTVRTPAGDVFTVEVSRDEEGNGPGFLFGLPTPGSVMKAIIEIELGNAAFEDDLYGELQRILGTVPRKVYKQLSRAGGCLCTAAEADDLLKDVNGNTVGTVRVEG